jgi:hypothetical protein
LLICLLLVKLNFRKGHNTTVVIILLNHEVPVCVRHDVFTAVDADIVNLLGYDCEWYGIWLSVFQRNTLLKMKAIRTCKIL